ncbi:MAG: VanZ family protein [Bacteroidota bacterium]
MKRIFTIRPWLRKIIGLFYLVLIVLLSLLPTSNLPDIPYFSGEDKVVHFCMYFGLGFMACWSLDIKRKQSASYTMLLLGIFLWGVLMEIMQRIMANGRSLEFMDMLANLVGAAFGIFVYVYLAKISKHLLIK